MTDQIVLKGISAKGFHGVLDFEKSEGYDTGKVGGIGEQAASVTVAEEEETQVRLHIQVANVTLSINVFFTGVPPEGSDVQQLTEDLGKSLVDALPRVAN